MRLQQHFFATAPPRHVVVTQKKRKETLLDWALIIFALSMTHYCCYYGRRRGRRGRRIDPTQFRVNLCAPEDILKRSAPRFSLGKVLGRLFFYIKRKGQTTKQGQQRRKKNDTLFAHTAHKAK